MTVQYCCGSGGTKKLFCRCFLLYQEANKVILNVWLCWMNLEGARLLKMHCSVSVSSGMSHHEWNHTAVSNSSQFMTKQKQIQVWQLQSKLVHSVKCKFCTERIALASSSKELHQIVNTLSNRHPPKILPTIYPGADLPSIFIKHYQQSRET